METQSFCNFIFGMTQNKKVNCNRWFRTGEYAQHEIVPIDRTPERCLGYITRQIDFDDENNEIDWLNSVLIPYAKQRVSEEALPA